MSRLVRSDLRAWRRLWTDNGQTRSNPQVLVNSGYRRCGVLGLDLSGFPTNQDLGNEIFGFTHPGKRLR